MKIPSIQETYYKELINKRSYLMGLAMIMVIIYHAFCWIYNPIGRLNIGFIGVDIFLFLSGIGLCLSYEKNGIKVFYLNRIKRIYPIYVVAVFLKYAITNFEWSFSDLIYNLLTLGIYTDGGIHRFDWYLESLFTLYILFPLFYFISNKKPLSILFVFITITIVLYFSDLSWWYECFISRLPIFLYGIIIVRYKSSYKLIGLLGILLFIPYLYLISPFLAFSLLTIPLIYILLLAWTIFPKTLRTCISTIGNYTLEIYIANIMLHWILDEYFNDQCTIFKIAFFIIFQIIFSYVIIGINKVFGKILHK